jgi:hypothetical protein
MERVACIIVGCNGADKEYRLNDKRRLTLASFWPASSCPACWRPWHCLVEISVPVQTASGFFIQVLNNTDSLVDSGEQCARIPTSAKLAHRATND